jgi:hypothetical protein
MPEMTGYDDGFFSWAELSTSDQSAARTFYSTVFGWEAHEQEIPGGTYILFRSGGKQVAGCGAQMEEEKAQGIPPHWNTYVNVSDVDKTTEQAREAGANVLAEPFDVLELGRMAVIADPTGAAFSLWQPTGMQGAELIGEPGAMSWNELTTPDMKAAEDFYTQLLGWQTEEWPGGGTSGRYVSFKIGDKYVAGMLSPPEGVEMPPFWGVYFEVEDTDAAAEKARGAGAEIRLEPTTLEGVGRFAAMADPQGAHFSVIKSEPSQTT